MALNIEAKRAVVAEVNTVAQSAHSFCQVNPDTMSGPP
jgi:hypothetical protein